LQEEAPTAAAGGGQIASHISTTAASFRDFLLKPEILRAINDCAFEVSGFSFTLFPSTVLMGYFFVAPFERYRIAISFFQL